MPLFDTLATQRASDNGVGSMLHLRVQVLVRLHYV